MTYHDISLLSVRQPGLRRRELHDLDDVGRGVAPEGARRAPVLLARLGVEARLPERRERRLVVVGDDGEVRALGDEGLLVALEVDLLAGVLEPDTAVAQGRRALDAREAQQL